jgi:hypothetical protein
MVSNAIHSWAENWGGKLGRKNQVLRLCCRSNKFASWPVSRVLSTPLPLRTETLDDHSSGTSVAGCFTQPTRAAGRKKPRWPKPTCCPYSVLLPVGFAVPLLLPVARCALAAPFHPCRCKHRRSVLCGTFPGVAPAGRYPAPFFRGARTFLPRSLSADAAAVIQPTGVSGVRRSHPARQSILAIAAIRANYRAP